MNAQRRLFVNVRRWPAVAGLAVGAAGLLSGCVTEPRGRMQVDASSPIAGEVTKVMRDTRNDHDYPSFSELPATPTDVRPVKAFGVAAAQVEKARADLERRTAPDTFSLKETQGFASTAQHDAGPEEAAPAATDSDAFARELRKRATPPPPPKR